MLDVTCCQYTYHKPMTPPRLIGNLVLKHIPCRDVLCRLNDVLGNVVSKDLEKLFCRGFYDVLDRCDKGKKRILVLEEYIYILCLAVRSAKFMLTSVMSRMS